MEGIIEFGDWEKIDLRVGQIKNAEDIEGADKRYKLIIDVGADLGEQTICAGIKEHYTKEELENKKIVIIANLAPRKLRGIESHGMLLAVSTSDHKEVTLISLDKDMEPGSVVG